MLYRLTILFFFLLFIDGCSSSARFTGDRNIDKSKYEKKESSEKEGPLKVYTDEYKNYPILETETGIVSFYSDNFNGKKTASGEIYNPNNLTAAHINYPFGTVIRVINLKNNKSVVVKVNDRRSSFNGRICDLSKKAAESIDMIKSGLAKIKIEVLEWGEKK